MARKLGNRGAGFKAKVALAAFKGDKTLAQLAQEYGAHTTQVSTWKQRLLEGASELFEDRRRKRTTEAVPVDELYQQIGRLKMELEWLKKKSPPSITAKRGLILAADGAAMAQLDGGRVLRVGRDFDAPTLRRLLVLLEEGQP
jgi:transposase-like protein